VRRLRPGNSDGELFWKLENCAEMSPCAFNIIRMNVKDDGKTNRNWIGQQTRSIEMMIDY